MKTNYYTHVYTEDLGIRNRKTSFVYRVPELLCCRMTLGLPPTPSVQKHREGGAISHGKGGWGDPNHKKAQKLWHSLYCTPFTTWKLYKKATPSRL
jgi:hypothetical protein